MSLVNTVGRMRSLLACGLIFMSTPALAQTLDKPSLFEEAVVFSPPEISGNALRSRSVVITDTSFTGIGGLQSRSSDASSISDMTKVAPVESLKLNLFDDLTVDVDLTNAYQNSSGSQTWVGKIQTDTVEGTAAFVIRDGQVYGSISVPGRGNFTVRPGESNSHIIEETDNSQILVGETDAVLVGTNATSGNVQSSESTGPIALGATVGASNDDGSIIDVYVGYDQDVDGGFVAAATAQSLAELFIAYTNQAYENSGISQRVWLVGSVDGYDFTSTTQAADLDAVKDGDIAGLHEKRDEYHADIVMFLRPHVTGATSCTGLAFLQETNGDVGFAVNAFGVIQACAFGAEVFAHELGHNMGSRHDWYLQEGVTPQTYAHGYVDVTNNFRTIMAYNNRCIAEGSGSNCTAIDQFSNPLLTYNGNATGVAAGSASDCTTITNPTTECDADNTRNFNEKAPTTSKFRDSGVIWTGTVDIDWSNAGNWSTNVIPRSYDNVLIPASLANYPIITAGTAEARELTIANGATLAMSGGALTVGWAWEDAGGFTATGGTVTLAGPIGVTLTSSGDFNNLEIGSGSDTSVVTLDSSLDVNGTFTINAGASFKSGANELSVAGNFDDKARGFDAGTSTVVFDSSTTQTVNKATTVSLLDESFDDATGEACCNTSFLPTGYVRSQDAGLGFLAGDIASTGGEAAAWDTSADSWLITTAVTLVTNTNYTLDFDYRRHSTGGTIGSMTAYYGASQTSGAMTNVIGEVAGDASFTTSLQTKQSSFTVPTDGVYYIGFNVKSSVVRTALDNIKLDGVSVLQFNNVKVASGETAFLEASEIAGNLEVDSGAILDLRSNSTTVDGTVTNNGEIKQMLAAGAGVTTAFVSIKSKDGSVDKYHGVDIIPSASANVTVSVKGNQTCTIPAADATAYVKRCYTINSDVAGTADAKFYYDSDTELNGSSSLVIKTLSGTDWVDASTDANTVVGGAGDASFVSANLAVPAGSVVVGLGTASVIDQIPESFTFTAAADLAGTLLTSNSITVTGINTATPITVVGGEYSIDNATFTAAPGTVISGNTVSVRNTTDTLDNAILNTVLSIGIAPDVVSDTYAITTLPIDITPEAFIFNALTSVVLGSTQTSNTITVAGINSSAEINVSGGSYKIGNGTYGTAPGTVENGDIVTVQHTASSAFNTPTSTVLTIGGVVGVGGVSETFTTTTELEDTLPDQFTFTDLTDVDLGSSQTSSITVSGINSPSPISVTNGLYRVGTTGAYLASTGTSVVNNGDVIMVQHTADSAFNTPTDTVVNIGGVGDTFTSTTELGDIIPDQFTFSDLTNVVLGSTQTSSITVSGINSPSPISVTNGLYRVGTTGAYLASTGTSVVNNGDVIMVQHTADSAFNTPIDTVVNIGGVSDTFTSTTLLADAVPDAFTFTDEAVAVVLGSSQESNAITVTGINTQSPISVTGGTYSISTDGGTTYTGGAVTVSDGDMVKVQHTAPNLPGATTNTELTIGGISDIYSSTTIGPIIDPNQFTFTDEAVAVAINSLQTSNTITVIGINTAAPISVTGGTYQIGSGAYTDEAGTVNDGDTVTVQHTASGTLGTAANTVLTIGGVSDTYTSTTVPADTTPVVFTFTDVTDVALSSTQTSNTITVTGVNTATPISVTGGSYKVNSGAYTSTAGTVNSGDTVTVQHTASAATLATVDTVLTIGGVSDTFTSTSEAPDTVPVVFTFTDTTGVGGSTQTSTSVLVTGINTAAPITVTGAGSYSINGGAFTSAAGTVNSGDTVILQHTLLAGDTSSTDTVLDIGGVSDTYTSTTVLLSTITPTGTVFASGTVSALGGSTTTVQPGTLVSSSGIVVAGLTVTTAPISVDVGEYSINGGPFTSEPGNVKNGDTVVLRHNTSSIAGGVITTTVTIGALDAAFVTKTIDVITGEANSGGGSMGTISLMFLSMFTLLCVARRRRSVTKLSV